MGPLFEMVNSRAIQIFLSSLMLLALSTPPLGCALLEKRQAPEPDLQSIAQHPLSPEQTEDLLKDVGGNWLYGAGLGESAVSAGTIFLFPPYALYLLGNAMLSLNGYEEIRVTNALPGEGREAWDTVYQGVTALPGKVAAGVAGEEYRTPEVAKERLDKYIHPEAEPAEKTTDRKR